MTTTLYQLAERCLYSPEINTKLETTVQAEKLLTSFKSSMPISRPASPRPIREITFPEKPVWVSAKQLPKRGFGSIEGRAALLHALGHIEFLAIHLAWDIIYRFDGMPADFYRDWLVVAIEEAQHFELIERRLAQFGYRYGDLPVHGGLWEMAVDTDHDVLARLALVPRYMEARGLDVTPEMIRKFKKYQDNDSVAVLEVILEEEIDHVRKGDRWFKSVCQQRELDPETTYFELLGIYLKGETRGPFNQELRLEAGFSKKEIEQLAERRFIQSP